MAEYASFRQRLDAVLRTRDVQRVSAFLIAEEQWEPGLPADPQFAMWMMIAGTPTLKELHPEARAWLIEHDHSEEADAILSRAQSASGAGKQSGRVQSGSSMDKQPGRSRRESNAGKQTGQSRGRSQNGSNTDRSSGQSRNRSQGGSSASKKQHL